MICEEIAIRVEGACSNVLHLERPLDVTHVPFFQKILLYMTEMLIVGYTNIKVPLSIEIFEKKPFVQYCCSHIEKKSRVFLSFFVKC